MKFLSPKTAESLVDDLIRMEALNVVRGFVVYNLAQCDRGNTCKVKFAVNPYEGRDEIVEYSANLRTSKGNICEIHVFRIKGDQEEFVCSKMIIFCEVGGQIWLEIPGPIPLQCAHPTRAIASF